MIKQKPTWYSTQRIFQRSPFLRSLDKSILLRLFLAFVGSFLILLFVSRVEKNVQNQDLCNPQDSCASSLIREVKSLVTIGNLEGFSITIAALLYLLESGNRKKQGHYQAWQVIDNVAAKVGTSYARIEALQSLNDDGVSLKRIDIPFSGLADVNLRSAQLGEANLRYSKLERADLSRAVLIKADFTSAVLEQATLTKAKLNHACFMYADLREADCREASFNKINLYSACLEGTDLTGANLNEANLERASLSKANLSGAICINANFCQATLIEANFSKANLTKANFTGAILHDIDFTNANLKGADFTNANLKGATVKGTEFEKVIGSRMITLSKTIMPDGTFYP